MSRFKRGTRPLAAVLVGALVLQSVEAAARVLPPIAVARADLRVLPSSEELACRGQGTNLLNGRVSVSGQNAAQPAGSPAIPVDPVFHSGSAVLTAWGLGWSSDIDHALLIGPQRMLTWLDGDANRAHFVPASASTAAPLAYDSPLSFFSTMTAVELVEGSPAAVTLREPDGTTRQFRLFESSSILRLSQLIDKNGNAVDYARDAQGRVTRVEDVHGRFFDVAYNAAGLVAGLSDSGGRSFSYAYDAAGRKTSESGPIGTTSYEYDAANRMTRIAYPNGGVKNYAYDAAGRVLTEDDGGGQNLTSYEYFASSTVVTDALGRRTLYEYVLRQGVHKPARVVDAAGGVTTYAYDAAFNLESQTDPLGRVTRYAYDSRGNVVDTQDAASGHTLAQYEPAFNQLSRLQDPLGRATLMSYDGQGNLTDIQDALGGVTRKSYDAQGHVLTSRDPLFFQTEYAYAPSNGALATVTDPLTRTTNLLTDPLSRVTRNTDPAGKVTDYQYDAAGNLTQVKDAINGLTRYTYAPGRERKLLETVTDAKGQTTTFGYDAQGRLVAVQNALGQTKTSIYDAKGNLVQTTNARGQVIAYEYDELDRLTRKTLPEGVITYAYDAAGNLTDTQHYNGSRVQTSHDALNRVTQVIQTLPGGYSATIGYGYDAAGNRTSMTTPWGSFSYQYDSLNRLTALTNPQAKTFTFQYDANGRRTKLIYPNGIETRYTYDSAGQVLSIIHERVSDGVIVAKSTYSYDAAGNRISMVDWAGTHIYGYDDLYRLTGASHPDPSGLPNETFTYDAVGNRLADSQIGAYTYDAANRLVENSRYTYAYDADGNRTSKQDKLTGHTTSYSFNSENQFTGLTRPDSESWTYRYDRPGRRVEKSSGTLPSQIKRFVHDSDNILAILDGDNAPIQVFTIGLDIDEPLAMRFGSGVDRFFHADALGSVRALTSIGASVVESYDYAAFGRPAVKDGSGVEIQVAQSENRVLYTARNYDEESDHQETRHRTYDGEAGAFLSEDPIGIDGGINLYAYVKNNPVRMVDRDGLAPEDTTSNRVVYPNNPQAQKCIDSYNGKVAKCINGALPTQRMGAVAKCTGKVALACAGAIGVLHTPPLLTLGAGAIATVACIAGDWDPSKPLSLYCQGIYLNERDICLAGAGEPPPKAAPGAP